MEVEDLDVSLKIIIVGNGGVGKTSLIQRFCKGEYTDNYKKTIGVDFLEKTWYVPRFGQDVRMMLWDTAGQEEFDALTRKYYRGAAGCVLAFSTTDRDSFDAVRRWKDKVEAECGRIHMVLMQNKIDLADSPAARVSESEGKDLAAQLGLRYFATCVKHNTNVEAIFDQLATLALSGESTTSQGGGVSRVEDVRKQSEESKVAYAAAGAGAGAGAAASSGNASSSSSGETRNRSSSANERSSAEQKPQVVQLQQQPQDKKKKKKSGCTVL